MTDTSQCSMNLWGGSVDCNMSNFSTSRVISFQLTLCSFSRVERLKQEGSSYDKNVKAPKAFVSMMQSQKMYKKVKWLCLSVLTNRVGQPQSASKSVLKVSQGTFTTQCKSSSNVHRQKICQKTFISQIYRICIYITEFHSYY